MRKALWSIGDNKAPGPDGFNAFFYKQAWDLVGADVIAAVQEFFSSGCLLKQLNDTAFVLMPKEDNPTRVTDYRPVSCCGTIYKIIMKILSMRLQLILDKLMGDAQGAFVQGRSMAQNILLSQELLLHYTRAYVSPRCAIKINLHKAYDFLH